MLPRATAVGAPTAAQYLSQKKKDARATAALQKKKKAAGALRWWQGL
jgi:hypothetical protein